MSVDDRDPTLRTPGAMAWKELDEVIDRLMSLTSEDMHGDRARADGMATIIAIMSNHHAPKKDKIKEIAMERWQKRNEE